MDTATTTPAPDPASDRLWEELVTAALLGTDRRTPAGLAHTAGDAVTGGDAADGDAEGGGVAGGGAAGALLDAAALHTVRRRAGLRP
ncbi:hypothetical protein ACFUJ0_31130, partial [Streptomyces sp. NPDC057242]